MTIASFQSCIPWICADKQTGTYLPQGQAPMFPHGWLDIYESPRYPNYDWASHKVKASTVGHIHVTAH